MDEDWWIDANPPSEVIQMEADEEIEKMALINLDKRRQALADYLKIDPKEVTA